MPVNPWILLALVAGLTACVVDPRRGFYFFLIVGFLQEVVRKVVPGQPVHVNLAVGVVVAATVLGMLIRGGQLTLRPVHRWYGVLRDPLHLFLLLVLFQAARAFYGTRSIIIPAIGILAYFTPFLTVWIGYHLTRSMGDVRRMMALYVVLSAAMISGVYLSVLGFESVLLEPVGSGLHAYSRLTGILRLHTGFFRGSELAGWHGATAACMLILGAVQTRRAHGLAISGILVAFILGAVLFTGRRKFLVEVIIFLAIYGGLLAYLRGPRAIMKWLVAGGIVATCIAGAYVVFAELEAAIRPYYQRGLAVQDEAAGRFAGLTWGAIKWIVLRNGLMGAGAGAGSQGAQHFGGGSQIVGSAAEGGLGKILAELGVPGVFLAIWVLFSGLRYMWRVVRYANDHDPAGAQMITGIVAFLLANGPVFMIAHQIYGDIFVLLVLGWLFGVVLAYPKIHPPQPAAAAVPAAPGSPPAGPWRPERELDLALPGRR